MKAAYGHLCEFASVSADGKLSVFNIFSQITATALPLKIPQMSIAWEWELSYAEVNKKHAVAIELVDQDGNKLFTASGEVMSQPAPGHQPKPGETVRIPQVINLQGAEFKQAGRHDVNFFVAGQLVYTLTFAIVESPKKAA
jgi:hypothetical protein